PGAVAPVGARVTGDARVPARLRPVVAFAGDRAGLPRGRRRRPVAVAVAGVLVATRATQAGGRLRRRQQRRRVAQADSGLARRDRGVRTRVATWPSRGASARA